MGFCFDPTYTLNGKETGSKKNFLTAKVAVQQAIRSTCLSVCLCVYNVEINLLKAHQLIRVQFETT